jgi:hypothetical protein
MEYNLFNNSPAIGTIEFDFCRNGRAEVAQRISKGEAVDRNKCFFQTTSVFNTASITHDCLNQYIYVGAVKRKRDCCTIHTDKVL